jgi:hypothetical protein
LVRAPPSSRRPKGASAYASWTRRDDSWAILRLDEGKFTVDSTEPRVKYWDPRREFKWQPRRKEKWVFRTPGATTY